MPVLGIQTLSLSVADDWPVLICAFAHTRQLMTNGHSCHLNTLLIIICLGALFSADNDTILKLLKKQQ